MPQTHELLRDAADVALISPLYYFFFPKEKNEIFNEIKLNIILHFKNIFLNDLNNISRNVLDGIIQYEAILINMNYIINKSKHVFNDIFDTIILQPNTIVPCIGIVISFLVSKRISEFSTKNANILKIINPIIINPKISINPALHPPNTNINIMKLTPFTELKSNLVGKLVCIVGYVVRISKRRPIVQYASFHCSKCNLTTYTYF